MKNLVLIGIMIFTSIKLFASGGVIGGGVINYKSLLSCSTESMDPTYPGPDGVEIAREVDWNGNFVPGSTLRVITMSQTNPTRFYVTQSQELQPNSDRSIHLVIWQYSEGSNPNQIIGEFDWNAGSQQGRLHIDTIENLELVLRNCH